MHEFRADLHIHSILSPCGSLDMSPATIVALAKARNIDILGITDHNSTKQSGLIKKLAAKEGIFVLQGAEVTSKEEVHCLTFFEHQHTLDAFQEYLDQNIQKIDNNPDKFGYQVVIDEQEMIVEEIPWLLISGINKNLDELEEKVHELDGLFIPAHVNRQAFSMISQLGFIPPDIKADALEISKHMQLKDFLKQNPHLSHFRFIQSSDAHYPEDLGSVFTRFYLEKASFEEIRMAFKNTNGRRVEIG